MSTELEAQLWENPWMVVTWGSSLYGNPCRECGFVWDITTQDAASLVVNSPEAYGELVSGANGNERHPDLGWSVAEYVCHVGDNLRIWAERLMGVAGGAVPAVGEYDENELADARNYEMIPLQAAMWSLLRSVDDWQVAVRRSRRNGPVLVHPERGEQSLSDVVVSNAHDAFHHQWDIRRTLEPAGR
jgi:DinB superfamily